MTQGTTAPGDPATPVEPPVEPVRLECEVELAGGPVEVIEYPPVTSDGRAAVVMLHEGLGSARLWRSLPAALAQRSGRRVIAWSRHGYGRSGGRASPRPVRYMHEEALGPLCELLASLGASRPVLVGHSDGASIALIHAGSGHPVAGIVAIAPHVYVEPQSLEGIRAARDRYAGTDLATRLGRHHADPDATFRGWNDIWLSPAFRDWNIEEYLPPIAVPVLVVQADDDEYGTLDQLDRIEAGVGGPFRRVVIPNGGHAPHLSHPNAVLEVIVTFLAELS